MTPTKAAFALVIAAVLLSGLAACAHRAHPPGPGLGPNNQAAAGLSSDQAAAVRTAYGTPQLVRKEADAELWRYDGDKCAAFFFLYTLNGELRLRFVETIPRGADAPADGNCLKTIRARAGATS
jgi:hypothetical protein